MPEVFYVGEHSYNLDARNRVTVPAGWRVEGDEQNYYMAWPHPDGCIAVYPPEMQKEFLEKARSIKQGDARGQQFLRNFFGRCSRFGCDKQGRILLPEKLKEHAGIDKAVTFVGMGRNFQLWSTERYEPEEFDLVSAMDELGF